MKFRVIPNTAAARGYHRMQGDIARIRAARLLEDEQIEQLRAIMKGKPNLDYGIWENIRYLMMCGIKYDEIVDGIGKLTAGDFNAWRLLYMMADAKQFLRGGTDDTPQRLMDDE